MLALFPHQEATVTYLKDPRHPHKLLWDEQRVGKTAPSIVASGERGFNRVLIVTPVAGVGVWKQQWPIWDKHGRKPVILPWSHMIKTDPVTVKLLNHTYYDLVILDEGHYAKNFGAKRTQRAYGKLRGRILDQTAAVVARAMHVWHLTGTPMPHDPGDAFSVLLALFPSVLQPSRDFPDVSTFEKFQARYCVTRLKLINGRQVRVVLRGQNTDELRRRLKGLYLRRRQSDVGIRPAFWDLLPVELSDWARERMEASIDQDAIRRAMAKGPMGFLDIEKMLAPVRRITGIHKAKAVVDDASDFLANTPNEKLVIAYWHKEVGDALEHGLAKFQPVRVDGAVTGDHRTIKVNIFQGRAEHRVFLAQIAACGEAIDLSAASEMWFAESTFTPSQMAQMGARITNLNQKRQCLVRVAALTDSIDEMVQSRLIDLSRSIAHTLGETYHENFARNRG